MHQTSAWQQFSVVEPTSHDAIASHGTSKTGAAQFSEKKFWFDSRLWIDSSIWLKIKPCQTNSLLNDNDKNTINSSSTYWIFSVYNIKYLSRSFSNRFAKQFIQCFLIKFVNLVRFVHSCQFQTTVSSKLICPTTETKGCFSRPTRNYQTYRDTNPIFLMWNNLCDLVYQRPTISYRSQTAVT